MQEKLKHLLNGLSVGSVLTKALWIIYFVTFYGLVLELLLQQEGLMDELVKVTNILSNIATVVGVCVAVIVALAWKRQVKAPTKYNLLVNFRQEVTLVEAKYRQITDTISVLFHRKKFDKTFTVDDVLIEYLRKNKKDFFKLNNKLHDDAKVIDLLFFGEFQYQDHVSLDVLTENLKKNVNWYLGLLEGNRELKYIDICRKKSYDYLSLINKQLIAYEEKI